MISKYAKFALAAGIAVSALMLAPRATLAAETATSDAAEAPAKKKPAAAFVDGLGQKALSSLTDPSLPKAERQTRVRSLLRSYFDLSTISRFVLGSHWREATDAQKAEYEKLFEDMIVKTYAQRFSEYSGQSFTVGRSAQAEKDTLVDSKIIQPSGPPVAIQWRVRDKGGSMKIVDVIVEGVSMSVTQRSDFASVIDNGGGKVEALLESLRSRTGGKPAEEKK